MEWWTVSVCPSVIVDVQFAQDIDARLSLKAAVSAQLKDTVFSLSSTILIAGKPSF